MNSNRQSQISICNETIYPGESVSLALRLPELYSCLPAYMPIKVFHGKKTGPTLLVFSAVSGNQINGTEIINKLTHLKRVSKLNGTLIAVPVVNVFELINSSKSLPGHVDLSRSFPGKPKGNHTDRTANLFIRELFDMADYAISLETGPTNCSNFPEIAVDLDSEESKSLAEYFGAPVIAQSTKEPGTLAKYAAAHKKKFFTYTAGEASRFDYKSIKLGLRGIINVMGKIGMIQDKGVKLSKNKPTFSLEESLWVRTPYSGISYTQVVLGKIVEKNAPLAVISDPFGAAENQSVLSPRSGIVIGINNVPLVKEGEALFKIAIFPEPEKVESHLKNWEMS